jgi:hypothetical protein
MQEHYHQLYHSFTSERKVNVDSEMADAEIALCRAERGRTNGESNGSNGSPRIICDCPETLVNRKRLALHRPSDCSYSQSRRALVFEAVRITNQKMGDMQGDSQHGRAWTKYFVSVMETLSAPLLKQSGNGS